MSPLLHFSNFKRRQVVLFPPLECEICEGRAWATLLIVLDQAWQVFHKYIPGRQAWPEEYSHQAKAQAPPITS